MYFSVTHEDANSTLYCLKKGTGLINGEDLTEAYLFSVFLKGLNLKLLVKKKQNFKPLWLQR